MVFFVCDTCQETVKKNKVASHCRTCPQCWTLVCVDCGVSFHGEEYAKHFTCITEAEKYQGALYRAPKQKTKRNPQGEWMAALGRAASDPAAPSDIAGVLQMLVGYDNVPRKAGRFKNFATNSLAMRGRDDLLQRTFEFIMSHWPKPSAAKKPADDAAAVPATGAGGAGAGTEAQAGAGDATPSNGAGATGGKPEKNAKKEKKEKKEKKSKKHKKDKVGATNGDAEPSPATKKRSRSTDSAGTGAGDAGEANGASKRPRTGSMHLKHKIKAALKSAGETGVPVDELRTTVVAQITDVDASVAEAAFNAKLLSMKGVAVRDGVVTRSNLKA